MYSSRGRETAVCSCVRTTVRINERNRQQAESAKKARVQQQRGLTREELREIRRKKRRKKVFIARCICAFFICIVVGLIFFGVKSLVFKEDTKIRASNLSETLGTLFYKGNDWTIEEMFGMLEEEGIVCTQEFLTINEYSRPGNELKKVKNIVLGIVIGLFALITILQSFYSLEEDEYTIHCLDTSLAEGLENSDFEKALMKLDEEE